MALTLPNKNERDWDVKLVAALNDLDTRVTAAETTAGAQTKADLAETDAKAYADTKALAAENNAKAYADANGTGKELAYAEVVSLWSTPAIDLDIGGENTKVTGLSFNVVGTGRPVEIVAHLPRVNWTGTGTATVRSAIVMDNAVVLQLHDQTHANGAMDSKTLISRIVIPNGVTRWIDVRMSASIAGTTALNATEQNPASLAVINR